MHPPSRPGLTKTTRALLAATLLLALGCGNTRPCRDGTLFLSLKFGALSQADTVTVDVTVNAGPKKTFSQPLSKVSAGSLELTFPSGYTAGSTVTILAALSKGSMVLAARGPVSTTLAPGCTSLEIDFGGVDAGAGGAGAGSGGVGGAAGKNGGSGGAGGSTGGTAGATVGTGGAGGSLAGHGGAAGAGVAGATAGSGGAGAGGTMGGSGGATGGAVGTGGAAGAGGKVVGSGGMGGTAAGGRGGAASGGAGGCMPAAAENCYNGVDDTCDGLIDCADPTCTPMAQCVAIDPTVGPVGSSVDPAAACPPEAPKSQALQNGLTAAGCSGCTCGVTPSTLVCSADIYWYNNALDLGCGLNTGGTLITTLKSTDGCIAPWPASTSVFGIRSSPFRGALSGTCAPGGAPVRGTPVWGSTAKFCGVAAVGAGCKTGFSCVPRPVAAAGACVLVTAPQTCPASTTNASTWFTGYADNRTCGACQCGAPTGGDCNSMIIGVGAAASCPSNMPAGVLGYVRSGDKLCGLGGAASPGLEFSGSPQPPKCEATSAMTGTLATTGPKTLCCL